jgi:hypothetical protein
MPNKRLILFIVVGLLFCLAGCSSKDPLKAPELKGADLEDFLNSPINYGPVFHNEHIKDIFYSSDVIDGVNILMPKNLGTKDGIKNIAIIIEKENNATVLYFEGEKLFPASSVYKYTFTKLQQGELIRYQNKMNPILMEILPNEYFGQIAIEIENYEKGEPEREIERQKRLEESIASFRTPEGWPIDSIYTSELILREGVLDMKGYTVGQLFYTGNRAKGVTVAEPKSRGQLQIIAITIKNAETNYTSTINLYLKYNSKTKLTFLEKIENLGGDGTKTISEEFREKYTVLTMILPYLLNEGKPGETY